MKEAIKGLLSKVGRASIEPTIERLLMEKLPAPSRADQIMMMLTLREATEKAGTALPFDDIGFNTYSSTYEDGILLYIFSLIGMTNRRCVDIGCGKIHGSNVANLVVNHGFSGLLVDGSKMNIDLARDFYSRHQETRLFVPHLLNTFITAENVNDLIRKHDLQGPIDLLSIDIDGTDYWIWKAIDVVEPRVVVCEYQDLLGPDRAWTVPYKPDFSKDSFPVNANDGYNYCGASLSAFNNLAKSRGYRLVGCSRGGWNAFFVKNGLADDLLPEVTTQSCFRYDWNKKSMTERFPLVKDMEWVEV